MEKKHFVSCIVAAGGSGTRMGADKNKLFLEVCGVPVLAHTLCSLEKSAYIDEIVLSAREEDMEEIGEIVRKYGILKVSAVVRGGAYRRASVKAGLAAVSEKADIVAVHDGARPLIAEKDICAVVSDAARFGAAAVGVRPKCTLKRADKDGFIVETVDRSEIFEIQTPQVFLKEILDKAYGAEEEVLKKATDDCSLVEQLGV
ncbi:MAG: 2-C-methyl-D-erythritol 4-phosphate cytidylyltransferase, partial [Clostridia bacterium]|nr:2-C-methyl-D-erythritol 4-phosphate cytidylyltransferase [Clostridia bacterium]